MIENVACEIIVTAGTSKITRCKLVPRAASGRCSRTEVEHSTSIYVKPLRGLRPTVRDRSTDKIYTTVAEAAVRRMLLHPQSLT